MIKKPKKEKCNVCNGSGKNFLMGKEVACLDCEFIARYNKALQDYEKFLPDEEELENIINNCCNEYPKNSNLRYDTLVRYIAKKIVERIGK